MSTNQKNANFMIACCCYLNFIKVFYKMRLD